VQRARGDLWKLLPRSELWASRFGGFDPRRWTLGRRDGMNAQTKAVTISTALCSAAIAVSVLVFGQSAETQGAPVASPPVERVSLSFTGAQPNGNSTGAVTSANGNCVAYYTDATNILPAQGDSNAFTDVYVYNRFAGGTDRVSVGFDGQNPNGPSMAQRFRPSIDADCTCVAFSSD